MILDFVRFIVLKKEVYEKVSSVLKAQTKCQVFITSNIDGISYEWDQE